MTTALQAKKSEVLDALKSLADQGDLTPRRVVDEARDPQSPLHGEFNWDSQVAAQQYWEWQARKLIERFHVYVRTISAADPVSVQVFVRDPLMAPMKQGFVEVAKMTRAEAVQSLKQEVTRLEGHMQRTWGLATAWKLRREFLRALDRMRASLK